MTSGTPPPLDSIALQNIATNQFKVNNQISALNQERGFDTTNLQSALAQLAYQQPREQLALEQKANQAGSLYSSVEGQNQGNLAYQFLGRQGAAQSGYDNAVARIAAQIQALEGGVPLYDAGQALGSAQRLSDSAAKNPTTGPTDPTATASPPDHSAAPNSARGGGGNTSRGPTGGGGRAVHARALARATHRLPVTKINRNAPTLPGRGGLRPL